MPSNPKRFKHPKAAQPLSSQAPPCSLPTPPNLAATAALLNEAAQALLAFAKTSETEPPEKAEPEPSEPSLQCVQFYYDLDKEIILPDARKLAKSFEKEYERGEFNNEIRCFRIPDFIVELEYKLCHQYKQENLVDLVGIAHDGLLSITMLMEHVNESVAISDYDLHMIARCLSRPLQLLIKICTQLANYTLIHKTQEGTNI